jgi:uncharacterized membrane protein YbhN (UPF0104 family)
MAVVAAVAYATVSQWSGVKAYLQTLAWPVVAVALLTVMAGLLAATVAWRSSLRYTGHAVPIHSAAQIYVIGFMAKYLPGSVWAFVLQMELGRRARLPRSAAFLASIVVAGLGASVAMVLGLFVIPALLRDNVALATGTLVVIPIAVVCAHPTVLTWLLRRLVALTRRSLEIPTMTWRAELPILAWSLAGWLVMGLHLWLLARGHAGAGVGGYVVCVGAVALGQTIGMLAFLAPSGLGVREAVIVAALAPFTSSATALGIALVSRLIFTAGDVVSSVIAALAGVAVPKLNARRPGAVTDAAKVEA